MQALHLNQPLMTASAAPVLCGWVATPGAACWALQVGEGTLSKVGALPVRQGTLVAHQGVW